MIKLGGRKFILALIAMGIGTFIEIYTVRGVSTSFAGLLAGLVAAFSAANFAVSAQHFKAGGAKGDDKLVKTIAEASKNNSHSLASLQEKMEESINLQTEIAKTAAQTQLTTNAVAQAVARSPRGR